MNTEATTDQPLQSLDDTAIRPQPEVRSQPAVVNASDRDRRTPLSDWFARPKPTEDQFARFKLNYEEAKAAHVDAEAKLDRLNAEVRRFTHALTEPAELEPVVASAQSAEVRARVLNVGIAADEAQRVLKAAQKRFDAAITAAREAELVLPDVQTMAVEQRKVVEQKKQALWKAGRELGFHSAALVLHGGLRGHMKALLVTLGNLKKLEEEYDSARPIELKLEHPNGGWYTPEEINAEA